MTEHPVLRDNPTLGDIQKYVGDVNEFRHHDGSLQTCLLLLCEEVGELAKASRKHTGIKVDTAKPADAYPDEEAADVLWMLCSICNALGIGLEQAFRTKEAKNKLRTWK